MFKVHLRFIMRYVENTDEVNIKATYTFTGNFPDSETIVSELIDKSDKIKRKQTSNRAMWPDQELVGISFDFENAEGHISSTEIRVSVDRIDDFDKYYNIIDEWTSDTSINMPDESRFKIDSVIFSAKKENKGLTYDPSKCHDRTNIGTCIYESKNIKSSYIHIQTQLGLSIDSEDVDISEAKDHIESFIEDQIMIITDSEDIESEVEEI